MIKFKLFFKALGISLAAIAFLSLCLFIVISVSFFMAVAYAICWISDNLKQLCELPIRDTKESWLKLFGKIESTRLETKNGNL